MFPDMTRLILTSLVLLLPLACSSDDEDPLTPEAFCERWAEAACNDETVEVCQAPDAQACQASQASFCSGLLPASFAPDQASSCLREVERAYEDARLSADEMRVVLRLEGACGNLSAGSVAEGASCSQRLQCNTAEGYDCVFKGTDSMGTCQLATTIDPGLRCDAPGDTCTDGFYCDGNNCIAGKTAGQSCTLTRECDADNYCESGTCATRLAVRQACTADEECASGLCYDFDDSGDEVCVDLVVLTLSEPLCSNLS